MHDDRIHVIVGREHLVDRGGLGPCGYKSWEVSTRSELSVLSWPLSGSSLPLVVVAGDDHHPDGLRNLTYLSLDGINVWKDFTTDVSLRHLGFSWQDQFSRLDNGAPQRTIDGIQVRSPANRCAVAIFSEPSPRVTVIDLATGTKIDITAKIPSEAVPQLVGVGRRLKAAVDDEGRIVCLYHDDFQHDGDVVLIPVASEEPATHCSIAISPASSLMAVASSPDGPLLLTGQNDLLPDRRWDVPYVAILDAHGRLVARAPSLPDGSRCIMNSGFQPYCWDAANRRIVLPPPSINYLQMKPEQILRIWHYDTGVVDEVHLLLPQEWQNTYASEQK